jgi:hypothetical protein
MRRLLLCCLAVACSEEAPSRRSAGAPPPDGPDLVASDITVSFESRVFPPGHCWVQEGCIGPGTRDLLHLSATIRNAGNRPLEVEPVGSACVTPFVRDFLGWRLLDAGGAAVASGAVSTQCISDGTCTTLDPAAVAVLPGGGMCDAADVTGVPAGDYTLEVTVDPNGTITERSRTNNTAVLPISVPETACVQPLCGDVCCEGTCTGGLCMLPDLSVDRQRLAESWFVQSMWIDEDDCAVVEGCVLAPGRRRLLRFSTTTPNTGNADLFIGDPTGNPAMQYSACHDHYHFEDYARYRLVDDAGADAALGRKQAFCLIDTDRVSGDQPPQYWCDYQGITVGWSDTYGSYLDCQWIDVTGVAEGDYEIEVAVNPAGVFREVDFSNNVSTTGVRLSSDPSYCAPGVEVCGDGIDQSCDGRIDEDCAPVSGIDACERAFPLLSSGTLDVAVQSSAFFGLQLDAPEIVYLSTHGSSLDTSLVLYDAGCANVVTSNDGSCGAAQASLLQPLAAGSYVVELRAATAGTVSLKLERSGGCADATRITGAGSYSGNTSGGVNNHGYNCARDAGGGPDQTYYFATCPGARGIQLYTCGSGFDTTLEVRRGACNGPIVRSGCNDDGCSTGRGSNILTDLAGDELWFVIVDGYETGSAGAYTLNVDL